MYSIYCLNNRNKSISVNIVLAMSALIFSSNANAEVYKTVTSDGKVVYTDNLNTAYQYNKNTQSINILDKLSTQAPQASSVSTEPQAQTTNQLNTTTANSENSLNSQAVVPSKIGDYELKVIAPQAQQTVRRASQSIEIEVATNPALKAGDRIIYKLNNKTLSTTKDLTYSIGTANLDPNKYTITVGIENIVGDLIGQESRDIYLLPNNVLIQQKRKAIVAEQKKQANLPWYKKIKIF